MKYFERQGYNKSIIMLIIIVFISNCRILCDEALDSLTAPIVREGKYLYQLETASWNGTDIFLENYTEKSKIGGYFSYIENSTTRCVFVSNEDKPKVIGTIYFDSTLSKNSSILSLEERTLSTKESEIWELREAAYKIITSDTNISTYEETSLNIIPIVENNEKKVYILTGTSKDYSLIIGNDYLINFSKNNTLLNIKKLHKNIMIIDISSLKNKNLKDDEKISYHSHSQETGDFISATDICTLMLYSKLYPLTTHIVVSPKYVSMWNCKSNNLMVLTKEVWEKFYKK